MKQTETLHLMGYNTIDIKCQILGGLGVGKVVQLQVFGGLEEYATKGNNATNNFTKFTELFNVNLDTTTPFTQLLPIQNHSHIFFRITQEAGQTAIVDLKALKSLDKLFTSAGVRDKTLALTEIVNHTRPTTSWDIDVADNNITGFENVIVKAKGALSTTETLLVDNITSNGYFDATRVNKVNVIKSSSTNDVPGGTGARRVLLNGLNQLKNPVQQEITLNGTNAVTNADGLIWVNSMTVSKINSGGLGFNVGDIKVWNTTEHDNNFMCMIQGGEGQSFNPQYEVPSNNNLYITKMSVFGSCVDRGYVKIAKYTYETNDLGQNVIRYTLLDRFDVQSSMNYDRTVNFTILDGERLVILKKSYSALQGNNDITVCLYGYLKQVNLTIQSSVI